jgi:hypothetical protein
LLGSATQIRREFKSIFNRKHIHGPF